MKFNLEAELQLIHPLANNVVIAVKAKSHGTEETSASGILLGVRQQGEVPDTGKIVKIGGKVDPAFLGKTVVLPHQVKNVPIPSVIMGKLESTKVDTKLITCNPDVIQVMYGDLE